MHTEKFNAPAAAVAEIKALAPDFLPQVGIVLGSGLGSFAAELRDAITIPYERLPGFPVLSVKGHYGEMVLGYMGEVGVVCLKGRSHYYEDADYESVRIYIRTLALLGCQYFIATNAAGSLVEDVGPGQLMLIKDHINFQGGNPLIGPNNDEIGPRFLPLDAAYDLPMRQEFLSLAKAQNLSLQEGVYICVSGPNYETAAEIRAFKNWGADAVGMSTIPEVLVAKHAGMRVAVISMITNYATGLATESHSHDAVVAMANQAASTLNQLLQSFVCRLAQTQI